MRHLSFIATLLLLTVPSCVLTSGQIVVSIDLPAIIHVSDQNNLTAIQIDLNANDKYADHKSDLDQIVDVALLGEVTNNDNGDPGQVEIWMTPDVTNYSEESQVKDNAIPLWGPFAVEAQKSRRIDWTQSVSLVNDNAFTILQDQVMGDGRFTLYALDRTGIFQLDVSQGALVLVLDAGL
jgi:hypothetical protein